jgi:hypothetical protein
MYSINYEEFMCYSKEIQLITSLTILFSAVFYYLYYSKRIKSKEVWQRSFLNESMLVFLCIGLHQFFEFLSLITNNTLVYKTGLIISICAVYFLLRSLEVLSNKKLHSWIALISILFVSFQIIFSEMNFAEASFYLRHNSAFFWAATWLLLFIYWHVCAFKIYSELKDKDSKKTILVYLLAIADVSFILSALYVLAGYFFFSVNVCTDSPSIWCTFYVVQSFIIPILMFRLKNYFKRSKSTNKSTLRQTLFYFLISLGILLLLMAVLPLFNCLTWKFVFP